jgi:hypothetical protein
MSQYSTEFGCTTTGSLDRDSSQPAFRTASTIETAPSSNNLSASSAPLLPGDRRWPDRNLQPEIAGQIGRGARQAPSTLERIHVNPRNGPAVRVQRPLRQLVGAGRAASTGGDPAPFTVACRPASITAERAFTTSRPRAGPPGPGRRVAEGGG